MKKVQIASKLLRMICISSCSGCVWLWWQYTVFIIRCYKFGETASSRRQRLKGSLNRMRFCTSNLLWDQFATAMELHSDVKKKTLWEWNGSRKGKRALQGDSKGNTGQFPHPELPRKLTHSSNHICTKCIPHLGHITSVASAGRSTGNGVNQTYGHATLFLPGLSLVKWEYIYNIPVFQNI